MRFRPLPLMSVLTLASLALLMWLGAWQYGRYEEKMAARDTPPDWQTLEGTILPGSEIVLYAYTEGEMAWQHLVAVDTGAAIFWTAYELNYQVEPPAVDASLDPYAGLKFSARGLYRNRHVANVLSADDAPEARRFQTFDAARLATVLPEALRPRVDARLFQPETISVVRAGRKGVTANPLAPLVLDGELPPQRHFGYALTWWGLALALIGVYIAYHQKIGRLRFREAGEPRP